jgi:IclR family transcriptional regulator, acetate operon repressor
MSSSKGTQTKRSKGGSENGVQSVSRAANLLMLVATEKTNASGKALAEAAGLAVPTAHHLLATLVAEGLLSQDERARYLLGPKVAVLADAFQRELVTPNYLMRALQALAKNTGESTYLAAWRQNQIYTMATIEGHHPVRVSVPSSPYRDAPARAAGKMLLALMDEDRRDAYLSSHPLRKLTPNTITRRADLLKELDQIRERGYALDDEEFQDGVSCVSAPTFEDGVVIAVFSLSVPTNRFHENRDKLIGAVVEAGSSTSEPA